MPAPPHASNADAEQVARDDIVRTCRRMLELGVNGSTAGNVSVRLGDRLLLTPSGIPYEEMSAAHIAITDGTGRYAGPYKPTSEWRLHCTVMAARPRVGAIVHTHPVYATAVACLRREIPALHYYIAFGGGPTIRCAAYAMFGTQQLADNVVAALHERDACLLANHGLLVVGATLAQALRLTVDIETLARQYVYAAQLGEPCILPDDEIERVRLKLRGYGTQTDDADLVRVATLP